MEGRRKKVVSAIIILLFYSLSHIQISRAFSITPSRAEFIVEPEKKYIQEYTIANPDSQPTGIKIFVEACSVFKESGDAAPWVKVLPREVLIPAGGSKKIKCVVVVPRGTSGEYTCSLVFRSLSSAKVGTVDVTAQISLMTYIIIKGTEKIEGEISKVEVLNQEPLKISVKVKNSGNIHVRPTGEIEIIKVIKTESGLKEKKAVSLFLNPIEGPIFPGSEGEIGPKNEDVKLMPGDYRALVNIEIYPGVVLTKEEKFSVPAKE